MASPVGGSSWRSPGGQPREKTRNVSKGGKGRGGGGAQFVDMSPEQFVGYDGGDIVETPVRGPGGGGAGVPDRWIQERSELLDGMEHRFGILITQVLDGSFGAVKQQVDEIQQDLSSLKPRVSKLERMSEYSESSKVQKEDNDAHSSQPLEEGAPPESRAALSFDVVEDC